MKKGIDYIGVGVGAIISNSAGEVFLAKRGKEARNEKGKWEFPGGGVDFNETLEHALVREVREEYGFEIEVLELLDVVDHIIPAEKPHWVSPSFLCRVKSGEPRILEPHKCSEIGWFKLDRIPEDLLTIASKISLERLRKKRTTINSYTYPVDALLLLGPTGVGKSPLGDAIAAHGLFGRTCHHLDFGAELRGALSDKGRTGSYSDEELAFIHGVLERGLLLENEHFSLAAKIISLFLERAGFASGDMLVLNGIPRHPGQARDIAAIARIHALIVLDCSADDVLCRIRTNVGGDRIERTDDNQGLIEKKLALFRERTEPLIKYYDSIGSVVYRITVASATTTSEAYQQLLLLAAAHPPVAFIAEPPH